MTKYLTEVEIFQLVGILDLPDEFSLMSQDSYNEEAIAKKILLLQNPKELQMCALNMAIVGYGNQRYGQFRLGEDILSIQNIMNKYQVKYNNPRNSLLKEDELTPQRLLRFYRFHIQKYILKTKSESYLWRKYSDHNREMRHICFRGAEYLNNMSPGEAQYYLDSVINLDLALGTRIQDRVLRVYQARGQRLPES